MKTELLTGAAESLFAFAGGLADKSGEEKMAFVVEQICNLDNATPLAIIPDKLEEFALKALIQKIYEAWKSRH